MSFKFLGIFILVATIFTYILISPLLSNLEYKSYKTGVPMCPPEITKACFLNIKAICFDYVSSCSIPKGWYIQETKVNAWVMENE